MRNTILVSIAIITVLSVIIVISSDAPQREMLFPFVVFSLFLSLVLSTPGVLISLITRIHTIRKRTQNNLMVRVFTLLSVVILSMIILSLAIKKLGMPTHYLFEFIPPMIPEEYEDYPYDKIAEFEDEFEQHQEAIIHETWIRVMLPPFLRGGCYTKEKDVCEFVDQFPGNKEIMSLDYYLRVIVFTQAHSLVGGVFAWHFTRRKPPQEITIEVSNEKE